MKPTTPDQSDHDDRVEEILGEWRAAREKGVAASPEDVLRQHPELADELRNAFRIMDALDDVLLSSSGETRPVPDRIGRYRVVKEVGRGGMGTVYLASDDSATGAEAPPVALKVVHPALMDQISDQAADGIVCKSGDNGRTHAEAFAQPTGDVVFAATLPGTEMAGRVNSFVPRIKPEHDFSQRQAVKTTGVFGFHS